MIWISLLVSFFIYVGYIIWDTVDARRSPAASIELKQSPFTFPDLAICETFLRGCLSETEDCFDISAFNLMSQSGFMEDPDNFDPADYPDVAKVEAEFPTCRVIPLSQLTVDETGVKNGDVTSFSASFMTYQSLAMHLFELLVTTLPDAYHPPHVRQLLWADDPNGDFNHTENAIFSKYISAHFIDIKKDVEDIGETITDVQLPYDRISPAYGDSFTTTSNHMVISLTEFSGITAAGKRKEREKTYSQTTTSGLDDWYWTGSSFDITLAILRVDLLINKFEYTSVQEVDPVDGWAIIGAIGGVWQFVMVAFGVFFIYSEKQPPDKRMRNFRNSVITPAITINRRLSSLTSSRSSQQDIEIDAPDEDLPPGWVKMQRQTGTVYYSNTNTGSTRFNVPRERDASSENTGATAASGRHNGVRGPFRVKEKSSKTRVDLP